MDPGGPDGVWLDDQRFLSRHDLRVGGERPRALAADDGRGDRAVHELEAAGARLRLERRVSAAGLMEERIALEGGDPPPVTIGLGADFLAMLALRGHLDAPPPGDTGGPLRFAARGSDGVERVTVVHADPSPVPRDGVLAFPPAREIRMRYELRQDGRPPDGVGRPAPSAGLEVDDPAVGEVLDRALLDLRTLRSSLDGQEYFAAGVPWYATLFGRDSILTASAVLPLAPQVAERTVRLLAGRLGRARDPEREEAPGKVLHELRTGEAAVPGATPLARYYGTVDATPLLLVLLADHAAWTGSVALFEELAEEVDAMLGWLDAQGELLAYRQHSAAGLRNQGWKDSPEGVPDEHGAPLEPPVALVEAQGYAIRARRGLAAVAERTGDAARAARLRAAADVQAAALERFWLPELRAYAMALDGGGRPSRTLASNQGHLLWAEVLGPARAQAVRDALMEPRSFSGWGLRTLAAGERAHDPLGYHLGAVWPHDTALAAVGLRRHGYDADFLALAGALLEAAARFPDRRLPEVMAGHDRIEGEDPVPYAASCRPQAWAAAAVPQLLMAGLGLRTDPVRGRLEVWRPVLPGRVERLAVRGLEVLGASVDLEFRRTSRCGIATLQAVDATGSIEVEARPAD